MVVCGQWEGVFPLCLSPDRGQHEVGVGPQDLPPVSFVTPPLLPGTRSCGLRPCPEQGAQKAVAHVKIMWDTASSFNSPREKATSFFSPNFLTGQGASLR